MVDETDGQINLLTRFLLFFQDKQSLLDDNIDENLDF